MVPLNPKQKISVQPLVRPQFHLVGIYPYIVHLLLISSDVKHGFTMYLGNYSHIHIHYYSNTLINIRLSSCCCICLTTTATLCPLQLGSSQTSQVEEPKHLIKIQRHQQLGSFKTSHSNKSNERIHQPLLRADMFRVHCQINDFKYK